MNFSILLTVAIFVLMAVGFSEGMYQGSISVALGDFARKIFVDILGTELLYEISKSEH